MPLYHTDVGSVETLEWGDGDELWLLLHAAAAGPGSLARLAKAVAAPGRRIVVPALDGYGGTKLVPVPAADAVARHVAVAAACLTGSTASRRCVFGHSMGGLIAVRAAMEGFPIDAVALYDPIVIGCLRDDDPQDVACRSWDRAILHDLDNALARGDAEAGVARFIEAWNGTGWAAMPETLRRRLVDNAAALRAELRAVSFCPLPLTGLAALALPTLVLHGAQSPDVCRRMAGRLSAGLPDADCVMLNDSAHMAPVIAPESIAAALNAWRGLRRP